jgi:hypothetical protein
MIVFKDKESRDNYVREFDIEFQEVVVEDQIKDYTQLG